MRILTSISTAMALTFGAFIPVAHAEVPLPIPVQSQVQKLKSPQLIAPGVRFLIPEQNQACSVGWIMEDTFTGDKGFITAGHCGEAGDTATLPNGTVIGTFSWSTHKKGSANEDMSFVKVKDWSLLNPKVSTENTKPTIHFSSGDLDFYKPDLCKVGQTTGKTCGNYRTQLGESRAQFSAPSASGDSGAPVYAKSNRGEIAIVGLISGSPENNDSIINVQVVNDTTLKEKNLKAVD